MGGVQVFVVIFAIVSLAVSVLAVWRVAIAPEARYKPLWIVGSLFGFFGFATSFNPPGDLYLEYGIQIPVLMTWMTGGGDVVVKAMFPVVAAIALMTFHSPGGRPNE